MNYGEEVGVEFDAQNNRAGEEIIVEVNVTGTIISKSNSIPLRVTVRPGERVRVGSVVAKGDLSSSWRWETSPNNAPKPVHREKIISKAEAKGVTLTQIQTPGERNSVEFQLENTLSVNVIAEIHVSGGTALNLEGKTTPIRVPVSAFSTANGGTISFLGNISVAFGWAEER